MIESASVLIVEDEAIVALEIEERLRSCGYDVVASVASGEKAIETALSMQPNLILMDIRLEGSVNGIEAAEIINGKTKFGVPIIFLTAYSDEQTLEQAGATRPYGYLLKPFKERELHSTIQMALRKFEMDQIIATNEENFRLFFENAPIYSYMVSLDGHIMDVNSTALLALNQSKEMLVGKPLKTLYTSDSSLLMEQELTDLKKGQIITNKEMNIVTADDTKRNVMQNISLVKTSDGNQLYILILQEDVTKSKQMEEALIRREEWFRAVFEESPIAINVFDAGGEMVLANRACLDMFGVKEVSDLRRLNLFSDPNTANWVKEQIKKDQQARYESAFDFSKVHQDALYVTEKQGIMWLDAVLSPLRYGDAKELQGYIVQMQDITSQKRAEEELVNTIELLKKTFESQMDAVFIFDSSSPSKIIDANPASTKMFGYDRQEMIGRTSDFLHVSEKSYKDFIRQLIDSVDTVGFLKLVSFNMKRKDRSIFPTELTIAPLVDEQDKLFGFVSVVRDVTEQEEAEIILKQSEEKYRTLAESSIQGIAINQNGSMVYANQAYSDITGYTIDEILAFEPDQIWLSIHPDDVAMLKEAYSRFLEGEEISKHHEFRILHKNGSYRWVESFFALIEYNGEKAVQIVQIDNTEKIQAEKNIEDSRNRAEFFLDLMSHDLSNIHQAVYGIFDLLLIDTTLSNSATELIQEGLYQMIRSSRLIKNVQKFKKIEDAPPELKPIDPFNALSVAIEIVQNDMPNKKINLKTKDKSGMYKVMADEYLTDAFYAILHNALRFDLNPQVDVEFEMSLTKDKSKVRIQVSDHGTGIPDQTKKLLFGRISLMKSGYLGTGIGLTLLNRIISHYGGQIYVEDRVPSDYRQGVKFILEIPITSLD
jgi:PAS domain S-box-containing protein